VNTLHLGRFNQLVAVREAPQGLYLESDPEDILLPKRWAKGYSVGDEIEVFVHTDSEDRLIATTDMPKAQVGEFAVLDVTDVSPFGAFLDWGLPKDLLCPKSQQYMPLRTGDKAVVRVCVDEFTRRIYATTKLREFMRETSSIHASGDEVEILALWPTQLGYSVLVDGEYAGLIHHKDLLENIQIGHSCKAWIKEVREDGKLGVSLKAYGYGGALEASTRILNALEDCGGSLPLHDKSDAQLIQKRLEMSKKTFKKAVGHLLKMGKIKMEADGISLDA
jgi:predicted RNA-binding protein (virulence factor B family)